MNNICRFTAPASRDIETIIDLMADNSGFDVAERFLKKVNQKCKNLAIFPNMGRRRDELLQDLRIWLLETRFLRRCLVVKPTIFRRNRVSLRKSCS
jgi:plasmid stabilization system protein ParE